MKNEMSQQLMNDLQNSVRLAVSANGIVNVKSVAEQIRCRHESENIALEDIAERVLTQAQLLSAAMEFDAEA